MEYVCLTLIGLSTLLLLLSLGYGIVWAISIKRDWFNNKEVMSMELFSDKELVCVECKEVFVWNKGEQEFYAKKGFQYPKRCKGCRLENKDRIDKNRRRGNNG